MNAPDIADLMKAAAERQLAVAALQAKYEASEAVPTEQLVADMRELLATERVVLDAIITIFVRIGQSEPRQALVTDTPPLPINKPLVARTFP